MARAELLSVVEGLRLVATVRVPEERLEEELGKITELGLRFLPVLRTRPLQGFAHRFESPKPGEPFEIFGVVGQDVALLQEFRKAFNRGDDRVMGALLGYPECCVEFFASVWPRNIDPALFVAQRTQGVTLEGGVFHVREFFPELNPFLRYFGLRAVPHIPCSLRCEESRRFSKFFLPHLPKETVELLAGPWELDAFRGVLLVKGQGLLGATTTFPSETPLRIKLG